MQKRRLGRTDLEVTPLGLGGNKFSGGKGLTGLVFPEIPQPEVDAIVQAALDGGTNWVDTAEMYGGGRSEQALAHALRVAGVQDEQVVVATKWSPLMRTAGHIRRSIDERLGFLGGYTIDLYMVHQPWGFSSPEAEMEAMADLVEAGKIRAVGVSNFDEGRLRRDLERAGPVVEALEQVAARHDATPAQVALNWLVNFQGEAVVTIPGASKVRHAAENAAACGFRLSEEELGRLDEVSRV
jgi:aryl-alcohol dehydrogenase-like predicted oxidoreductase